VEEEEEEEMGAAPVKAKQSAVRRTIRLLGNKEKKKLRAYAHQLGDDICVHQVRNYFSNLTKKDLLFFFFFSCGCWTPNLVVATSSLWTGLS
jgi:hypothetical protein